jgi:hypothetical protein
MTHYLAPLRLNIAVAVAALSLATAAHAAELDPAAVAYKTPDQFIWADPTDKLATNRTVLIGDPEKPGSLTSTSTSSSPTVSAIRTIIRWTASSR